MQHASLREDLMEADLVIPSLDAVTPEIFNRVNQPHHSLSVDRVIRGLEKFIRDFNGLVWLEILLVRGVNDSSEELQKISNAVKNWEVDKIQINTVERPAPDGNVEAVSRETLDLAVKLFGSRAETIEMFLRNNNGISADDKQKAIVELIKRRPCSVNQLCQSLDMDMIVVSKYISILLDQQAIRKITHNNEQYFMEV
jgi:wyosine [tRNA(Phe)-imidazoG37] synthetase (radical SAM superfamily)